ncbi:AAA family ATPase [Thalassotalea nanhaiensis]|uniref:AAA family ATPase n=1 Tax=Thalassotalea nanhaiensis TaxID=3065648 RepID=A0ABY9TJH7_9GAMM|nr:AAA family ATPase [Colwelliaceae bacterium SQ345]
MYNGYTGYFGLNDIPFSIAPNPHYLFMSGRHQEALAHLTYGLGDAGGFVLLTGEVGTGKTTVSKCLLEQLPDNTQAAFILNPTLSAKELLATVCDELSIDYNSQTATLKNFTDIILDHLLMNHQQGKNTLLIIDEAQHLQAEVLEQLRLLTNLETHTKKLLQVILIGQPELQELLKRRDLRQLAQRITARYHLLPLNQKEVSEYIKHRLSIAGCTKSLFKPSAITLIHKITGGVPRLVNLLCDRALLGAYSQEKSQVDKAMVAQSAKETLGLDAKTFSFWHKPIVRKLLVTASMVVFALTGFTVAKQQSEKITQVQIAQQRSVELNNERAVKEQLNTIENTLINSSRNLDDAFSHLFANWKIQALNQKGSLANNENTPCEIALNYELQCYWYQGDFKRLLALGYPASLQLFDENGDAYYATITKQQGDKLLLNFNKNSKWLDAAFIEQHYQGSAVLLWRSPDGFIDRVDENSQTNLVQWLEGKLSVKQQREARNIEKIDPLLMNQLGQYQQEIGLNVNHLADTETVMALAATNTNEQVTVGGSN